MGYVNSLEGIIGHLFSFSVICLGAPEFLPQKKTFAKTSPQGPPPSLECLIWAERTGGTSGTAALRVEMDCEAELQDVEAKNNPGSWGMKICVKKLSHLGVLFHFFVGRICARGLGFSHVNDGMFTNVDVGVSLHGGTPKTPEKDQF